MNELDPKVKAFFDSVPSVHQTKLEWKTQLKDSLNLELLVPMTMEDFTVLVHSAGRAVIGGKKDGRIYYGVIEPGGFGSDVPPNVMTFYIGFGEYVKDLGEGGVLVSKDLAQKLKESIFGPVAVSDDDIRNWFEYAREQKRPTLQLQPRASFGDFIEQYERIEHWPYCTVLDGDRSEVEEKTGGSVATVIELELYSNMERYLRRKGLLKVDEMLNPEARFFPENGRLLLQILDNNDYFYHFLFMGREGVEAPNEILNFVS